MTIVARLSGINCSKRVTAIIITYLKNELNKLKFVVTILQQLSYCFDMLIDVNHISTFEIWLFTSLKNQLLYLLALIKDDCLDIVL